MRTRAYEGNLISDTGHATKQTPERQMDMGLFNLLMNYGKARVARRVLGRVAGGNIFVMMLAGYVGKRVLNHFMANRRGRLRS